MSDKKDKKKKQMHGPGDNISLNRSARFEYSLDKPMEAGLRLLGSEVKSLREGRASINEAFVTEKRGELFLMNATIEPWGQTGAYFQHAQRRPRKLLMKKSEIHKLSGAIRREGYTIIPLRLYFSPHNKAKLEIALAKGKQLHDKRAATKERDWGREKQRLLKQSRRG